MEKTQLKMARLNKAAKIIRERHGASIFYLALQAGLSVDYARKEYRILPEICQDILFDGVNFSLKPQPEEQAGPQAASQPTAKEAA